MYVAHGTWVPKAHDDFYNYGRFFVWFEGANGIIPPPKPYKEYADLIRETIKLPVDKHGKELPSMDVSRFLDFAYPEQFNIQDVEISGLNVNITDLSSMMSVSSEVKIGNSLHFWHQVVSVLRHIFLNELFIPSLKNRGATFVPKWSFIYPDLDIHVNNMPYVCANGYDKKSLINHFLDYWLNDGMKRLYMPGVFEKRIKGTFLESFFNKTNKLTKGDYEKWRLWSYPLNVSQKNLTIKLSEKNKDFLLEVFFDDKKNYLIPFSQALRICPMIEKCVVDDRIAPIDLTPQEAFDFLKNYAFVLQSAGFDVIIPSWFSKKSYKSSKIKAKAKKSFGFFTPGSLIEFDYALSLNGEEISEKEWLKLIENKEELVQLRGQWVQLDLDHMQKILDQFNKKQTESADLFSFIQKTSLDEVELDNTLEDFMMSLASKEKFDLFDDPDDFKGRLYPYQKKGFSWMHYLSDLGLNPCLADDMGLGKTIQIIALLLKDRQKPNLLIVPTSLIGNWQREFQKFAPNLTIFCHHGAQKTSQDVSADVILTSYTMVRKDHEIFDTINWHRIIVDEAQNIKNPDVQQTKAILKLTSKHRIAMTGTPIENSLTDLWSIFQFLNPAYLGSLKQFKKTYEGEDGKKNIPYLKRLTEPFILRRVKTDKNIIQDLPDKIEQKVYCPLTKEQASLYQTVVDKIERTLEGAESGFKEKEIMLTALIHLKQICNHPAQFLKDNSHFSKERSQKLDRLDDMIEEIIANDESILIFSQYKEICEMLNGFFKNRYNTYLLHGQVPRLKRDQMVEDFQDPDTPPSIFLLSLKAGGTGLTLTKANHVFHFDRWWNPSVENQATDRAFRIGQTKKVLVHKFITIGTLEEKIDALLEKKRELSESVLSGDERWLSELNPKTFLDLIKLRKEMDQ